MHFIIRAGIWQSLVIITDNKAILENLIVVCKLWEIHFYEPCVRQITAKHYILYGQTKEEYLLYRTITF